MIFEYRDHDGETFTARPLPGVPAILLRTSSNGTTVPAALIEEAVAGIRDAARQTGQQPECAPCDDTGACNGGPCAHPAAGLDASQPATDLRAKLAATKHGAAGALEMLAFDLVTASKPLLPPDVRAAIEAHRVEVRAAVLCEAADAVEKEASDEWDRGNQDWDTHDAAALLRRMAEEASR